MAASFALRSSRARLALAFALPAALGLAAQPGLTASGSVRYVSTSGSDSNSGTFDAPYRTVAKGLSSLRPGDTLLVRGGTYVERITDTSLDAGTADARILVSAYPNERPVIQGLLWLRDASYWTISGINVTWSSANSRTEHMVKLTGGTGWRFTNAEVWGARSYAGILVAGTPAGWTLSRLYVHDTYASNDTNQDHLIYVNAGTGGGIIERNVLAHSPNGRAIKVGTPPSSSSPLESILELLNLRPPPSSSEGPANVVIRHNTMFDESSNVQVSYDAHDNRIYRNIMVRSASSANATAYQLSGENNVVSENLGWESDRVIEEPESGYSALVDGGGNALVDPRFADAAHGDFHPLSKAAQSYGAYAP